MRIIVRAAIALYLVLFSFIPEVGASQNSGTEINDKKLSDLASLYLKKKETIQPFWASLTLLDQKPILKQDPLFSKQFIAKREAVLSDFKFKLRQIDPNVLSNERKPDYYSLDEDLKIQSLKFKLEISNYLIFTRTDPARSLIELSEPSRFINEYAHSALLSKMNVFNELADQLIFQEQIGISKGYIDSCSFVQASISRLRPAAEAHIDLNPFFRPIYKNQMLQKSAQFENVKKLYQDAIRTNIIPGYKKILSFLETQYLPICRTRSGLSYFSDGTELYRLTIADKTSLFLSPYQIAKEGFKEVIRIKKEMVLIQKNLNITGSFKNFLDHLRESPGSYFTTKEELILKHQQIADTVKEKLPKLFSQLPKSKLVLDDSATNIYPAYFKPTPARPYGIITLPVGSLKTAPVYEVTSLMLHEAEPGHHFQLALEFENPKLSSLTYMLGHGSGFMEGWALYAESLGYEMGLYNDPIQRFGNLTNEMLRALRMVVDTELHYFGWSRQDAIDFMTQHLPYTHADIAKEVDRYINYPGQAISYKVGEIRIRNLRKKAEKELGKNFDIKEFHSQVLNSGTISLNYLSVKIDLWIKEQLGKHKNNRIP